jgi:hypothetical protein
MLQLLVQVCTTQFLRTLFSNFVEETRGHQYITKTKECRNCEDGLFFCLFLGTRSIFDMTACVKRSEAIYGDSGFYSSSGIAKISYYICTLGSSHCCSVKFNILNPVRPTGY